MTAAIFKATHFNPVIGSLLVDLAIQAKTLKLEVRVLKPSMMVSLLLCLVNSIFSDTYGAALCTIREKSLINQLD